MSATQITLQSVIEAVFRRGLSGLSNVQGVLLLAEKLDCQNHPLIRARLNDLRNTQMTEVDESAQSFTRESHHDFSDTDKDELYHAQSQIPPEVLAQSNREVGARATLTTVQGSQTALPEPKHQPTGEAQPPIPATTVTPSAAPVQVDAPGMQLTSTPKDQDEKEEEDHLNLSARNTPKQPMETEPSILQGSDDTVIIGPDTPLLTKSEFENLFYATFQSPVSDFNLPPSQHSPPPCQDGVPAVPQNISRQDGVPAANQTISQNAAASNPSPITLNEPSTSTRTDNILQTAASIAGISPNNPTTVVQPEHKTLFSKSGCVPFRALSQSRSDNQANPDSMVGRGDNQVHAANRNISCQGGLPTAAQTISQNADASNRCQNSLNEPSTSKHSMSGKACNSHEECKLCGKTFAAKHHLKRHLQMVHNKQSSNKLDCPKCFKGFAHISNLNRHVKKCMDSASDLGYECLQCKQTFVSTSGLKKHCAQSHNVCSKRVRCRICNTQFEDRSQLFRHRKQTHTA